MRPSSPRSRPPRGFTLVELLVSIAIIAILVAVTTMSVMSAMTAAKRTKCIGNMRAIGVAIQQYTADDNNVLPQRYYNGNVGGYDEILMPYLNNNGNVFVCPSFYPNDYPAEPAYGMNWWYDNVNAATIPNPSQVIILAEAKGATGLGSHRADRNSESPGELDTTRHGGKSNYLFCDGHVETLTWLSTTTPVDLWGTDHGQHDASSASNPSP